MKLRHFLIGLVIVGTFVFTGTVLANPSMFAQPARLATATSTVSHMSPGVATTTLTFDSYGVSGSNQTNSGITNRPEFASLLVQFTASSTLSTLNIAYEYSMDGIDWYQDNLSDRSTTTPTQLVGIPNSTSWLFASSTPGKGNVLSNTSRDHRILTVPMPTRFIRAIFTIPPGAANGAVYAEILPVRQQSE